MRNEGATTKEMTIKFGSNAKSINMRLKKYLRKEAK